MTRQYSKEKYLDRRRSVDVGELGQEAHRVEVLAAGGLGQPAEEGHEEEQEVDDHGHLEHLPPPPQTRRAEGLSPL